MHKGSRVLVLAAIGVALSAPAASAGTFEVVACDAAPGFANNSWRSDVTHGGMTTFVACPSGDNQYLGLGARNNYYPSGWTVPGGAAARWLFEAPGDTAIVGIRANALFEQRDHRWQVGLSNGSQLLEGCAWSSVDSGGSCGAAMYAANYLAVPPSRVLYTEVFCPVGPCPVGGGSYWAWASVTYAAVTVDDETQPSIGSLGGDLWTDRWIGGTRRVTFDATDNTGVKEVRLLIDGRQRAQSGQGCDPTAMACPNWPGATLDVATADGTPDGKHQLTLQAVDRGDNVATLSRDVRIDNTPPAAPRDLAVADGDGWRAANAFTVRWTNPPQTAAPIAGAEYRLCRSGSTTDCVAGSKSASDIHELSGLPVPKPGDWTLTLWLRDEAGNARSETAAPPVHMRMDPDPPTVAIAPPDPEDPARVSVVGADTTSGIARGEIELRRRGATAWRSVPAELTPAGFAGVLDDEHLKDGVYELRAHAWDGAGNERSSEQRSDNQPATLTLPLRIKTSMRVGERHRVRARGARRHRRVRTIYVRRPLVRNGHRVRVRGRLTAPGGNPLASVDVDVTARYAMAGAAFQPVASLKTSRTGRFTYLVPAGPSRILRFRYPGAPKVRAQTRYVHVRVRAASTIHADRHRVVNGEPVTFYGQLRSGLVPAGGKLIELQFFDRGNWRTFRTLRAAPSDGRWRYTYRFDGTHGTRRYRFRVRIPSENGYPFSPGASRRVAVKVHGL
jgi:hypothetical protein